MRILQTIVVAAAALLTLTACTAPQPAPATPTETAATAPTASPTPTPTPAPTPMPTPVEPVAVDPADLSTWLIDAQGVGPLRLGTPLDDAVAALPSYVVGGCPNPDVRFLRAEGSTDPLLAIAAGADGNLALIILNNAVGPATAEGIRIGSAVADAKASYPDLVPSQFYTDRYTLEDSPGFITFATADRDDGDDAPIVTISVVAGGLPPSELCG